MDSVRKIDIFTRACKNGNSNRALSLFTKHKKYAKIVIRYAVEELYHLVDDLDDFDDIDYAVKVKNKSYIKREISLRPTGIWQFCATLRVGLITEAYEIKDRMIEERTPLNSYELIEATIEANEMDLYKFMMGITFIYSSDSMCKAAVRGGNMKILKEYLKDYDLRDLRDLACYAAESGQKEMVDCLIELAKEREERPKKGSVYCVERSFSVEAIAAKAHSMYLLLDSEVYREIFDSLADRCSELFLVSCAIKRNDRDYVEKHMMYDSSFTNDVMKSGNMVDIFLPLEDDWKRIVEDAARYGRVKIVEDTIRARLEYRSNLGNRSRKELIAIINYIEGDKDEAIKSFVKDLYFLHPDTIDHFGIEPEESGDDE